MTPNNVPALAVLALLLAATPLHADVQLDLQTSVDADGAYRSVGTMTLPFPAPAVAAKMVDFPGYDRWAPRGQDGRDPVSAAYIGQLTGVRAGEGFLDLICRINLFWPLGSSGQVVALALSQPPGAAGTLQRVRFTLKSPSLIVPVFDGDFILTEPRPGESHIVLDCRMKLAWFLRPFFPLEAYRVHVVKRLETALRSFAADLAPP